MARRLSRRELMRLAALGAASTPLTRLAGAASRPGNGVIGLAKLAPPAGGGAVSAALAREALAAALKATTGAASARDALASLFKPSDVVAVKLNCLSGRNLSPRRELVEALVALLGEAGVTPERVIAFDRSSRELQRAGFSIRRDGEGYRCYGIDNDYEAQPSNSGAIGSCFARLVASTCTALIGFGVVKDHDLSGVSASLKNWYGVIHNPNKYHDGNCNPYAADVFNHPYLRDQVRLTVLDGVVAQCHGGPAYRPDSSFPLGLVVASTDPVAVDAWAWKVIDAERRRRGLPTLAEAGRPPRFLATAARYGLGVGDPAAVREVLG